MSRDKRRRDIGRLLGPDRPHHDGPGRLAHTRCDRNGTGSGGKRASEPETKVVVPIVGGEPVAVRRAEEDRSDEPGPAAHDTATRGRPGFKGIDRIEPAALEDRVTQAPRIGVLGMSDPSAHARLHILDFDRSGPPSIPQAT